MPVEWEVIDVPLATGLNTRDDEKLIPPTRLLDLQNAVFEKGGALRKRNGYRDIGVGLPLTGESTDVEDADALTPGHPIDQYTVGMWRLDEAAAAPSTNYSRFNDSASGARHLTILTGAAPGSATDAQIVDGPDSSAARASRYFDGSLYGKLAGDAASLAVCQGNWTFECWVKPETTGGRRYLLVYANATSELAVNNYQMSVALENSGAVRVFHESGAGVDQAATQTAGTFFTNSVWQHLAVVKSGTSYKVFRNGVLQDTLTIATAPTGGTDATVSWWIGQSGNDSSIFKGRITSMRLQNTALADATVAADAALATYLHAEDANTFLHFRMNEQPGAYDSSGQGLHLKQIGGTFATGTPLAGDGGLSRIGDGTMELTTSPLHPNNTALRTVLEGNFTVECWVRGHYPWDSVAARGLFLYGVPGPETAPENYLGIQINSSRQLLALMENGAGVDSSTGNVDSGLTSAQRYDRFHLAVTKFMSGGSAYVEFYVNGQLVGTSTALTNFDSATNGYLRLFNGPGGVTWVGELDDVRLSNIRRTAAEILESYNRGA